MSKYADKRFWVDAIDRMITSFAQGAIASLGLDSFGILDVDWVGGLSLATSYAVLSLLSTIAFRGTPSEEVVED